MEEWDSVSQYEMEVDVDIVKCWAYNMDGLRCMQPAGHDGPHAHAIEWPDEESWTPEMALKQERAAAKPAPAIEHLTNPVPTRCALCNHGWHEARCRAKDGDFDCDCAAGVPD